MQDFYPLAYFLGSLLELVGGEREIAGILLQAGC